MESLAQIAARYDTDKAAHARYLRNYEEHFSAFRDSASSKTSLTSGARPTLRTPSTAEARSASRSSAN